MVPQVLHSRGELYRTFNRMLFPRILATTYFAGTPYHISIRTGTGSYAAVESVYNNKKVKQWSKIAGPTNPAGRCGSLLKIACQSTPPQRTASLCYSKDDK